MIILRGQVGAPWGWGTWFQAPGRGTPEPERQSCATYLFFYFSFIFLFLLSNISFYFVSQPQKRAHQHHRGKVVPAFLGNSWCWWKIGDQALQRWLVRIFTSMEMVWMEQSEMLLIQIWKILISDVVALIQPVPEDRTLQALCFFLESTAPVGR